MSDAKAREEEARAFRKGLPEEEKDARGDGTFFSDLEDLWEPVATPVVDNEWYQEIVRSPTQGRRLYPETVEDQNLNFPMAPSATSDATNTIQSNTNYDCFRNNKAQKAHLISDAKLCHKAYGFVAAAATGKTDGTKDTRLKLLNGVKPANSQRTINHTGLKHHKFNKLYLFLQKEYYDARPSPIMIIPLLELKDVLAWNGTDEYYVLVLSFGEEASSCQYQVLSTADKLIGTGNEIQAKVEMGRQLVETFTKALASSDMQHPVEENFDSNEGSTFPSYQQWRMLLNEIRRKTNPFLVDVPRERRGVDWNRVRVAVGKAELHSSLPDPFLLAVKAAINYSAYRNMALLPSCPPASETSSDGKVNTLQGKEDFSSDEERDFTAVARAFQNPNRKFVEMFSAE